MPSLTCANACCVVSFFFPKPSSAVARFLNWRRIAITIVHHPHYRTKSMSTHHIIHKITACLSSDQHQCVSFQSSLSAIPQAA